MEQQQSFITKGLIAAGIVLTVVLLASFVVKSVVLQGVTETNLEAAPALAGSVAQGLITNDSDTTRKYGEDFTLTNTKYFENNAWAVTRVKWTDGGQGGTIILHRTAGMYRMVAGPGSTFPGSITRSMPDSVSNYLREEGLLHG